MMNERFKRYILPKKNMSAKKNEEKKHTRHITIFHQKLDEWVSVQTSL